MLTGESQAGTVAQSRSSDTHATQPSEKLALIVPPEHRPRHISAFQTALDRRQLVHDGQPAHITAVHREGLLVPAVMTLGLTDSDAGVHGFVAVLRTPSDPTSFI